MGCNYKSRCACMVVYGNHIDQKCNWLVKDHTMSSDKYIVEHVVKIKARTKYVLLAIYTVKI